MGPTSYKGRGEPGPVPLRDCPLTHSDEGSTILLLLLVSSTPGNGRAAICKLFIVRTKIVRGGFIYPYVLFFRPNCST